LDEDSGEKVYFQGKEIVPKKKDQAILELEVNNLSPRQATNETFKSFFICQICFKVLSQPKECKECQTAFCGPCVDSWLSK
jgi:hypothetical protein